MRAVAMLAVLGGLAGCGDESAAIPDGGADAEAIVTADALCRAPDGVLVRLRARLDACAPDRADGLDVATFEALCRASIEPYLRDRTISIGDDAALAACAAYADGAACADLDPMRLGPCAAILVGRQPIDAACERDAQCATGGYCAIADGCGTCRSIGADGAACDRHDGCASGRCASGVCAAPAIRGEACADDGDCAGALRCQAGVCGDAAVALDAPCDVTLEACAPAVTGRFCAGTDELADRGTCQAFAARGEACVGLGLSPGAWCDWTAYDTCVDGRCAAGAPRDLGDACDPEARCAPALVCREPEPGAPPTCAAPIAAGGACLDPDACAAPLSCVGGHCQLGPYTGSCPAG